MKKPVNLTELLVSQLVEEQCKKRSDVCFCDTCKADIMAMALNHLPPRYVNTDKGELFVRTGVLNSQLSTDLLVEVSKAIEHVSKNPRH
ncbi:MAG: competence protein ComFB [Clostridia bacterium]|jgi:competence protein ComFB|nr:competence protein ComFB [Clostridia bacterium]MDN5323707.1 competence protein ComFB [Clostridia bacterium]